MTPDFHFCIAYRGIRLELPDFVRVVATEDFTDKGVRYQKYRSARVSALGEDLSAVGAALYIAEVLSAQHHAGRHVNVFNYRAFMTQRELGYESRMMPGHRVVNTITKSELARAISDFRSSLIFQPPTVFPRGTLHQYARAHHVEDFLALTDSCVRTNVLSGPQAEEFCETRLYTYADLTFCVMACELYIDLADKVYRVLSDFCSRRKIHNPRDPYQKRALSFFQDRLVNYLVIRESGFPTLALSGQDTAALPPEHIGIPTHLDALDYEPHLNARSMSGGLRARYRLKRLWTHLQARSWRGVPTLLKHVRPAEVATDVAAVALGAAARLLPSGEESVSARGAQPPARPAAGPPDRGAQARAGGEPLVSICIPAFNAGSFLADAVRSALHQTCRDLEIIVFDNASTDDTPELARAFARVDPRVRYLQHASNIGMVGNFNACIEHAKGWYIKFVCADDVLEPECVERLVRIMMAHPRVSLVACGRRYVDESSQAAGTAGYSRRFVLTTGAAAARRCFFRGNVIGEPTAVMFSRADATRGFDVAYPQIMDMEMWIHVLDRGEFAFLPDLLCGVRLHAGRATERHLQTGVVLENKRRFFHRFVVPARAHDASLAEKLLWDARMAVTVYRTRSAGHAVKAEEVEEVFFRWPFAWLTCRLAPALWRLLQRYF